MTLTLEQVRKTRFHLARRNGYEPVDVDNFVDQVEATLLQLGEENETLKSRWRCSVPVSRPASSFLVTPPRRTTSRVNSPLVKANSTQRGANWTGCGPTSTTRRGNWSGCRPNSGPSSLRSMRFG